MYMEDDKDFDIDGLLCLCIHFFVKQNFSDDIRPKQNTS